MRLDPIRLPLEELPLGAEFRTTLTHRRGTLLGFTWNLEDREAWIRLGKVECKVRPELEVIFLGRGEA